MKKRKILRATILLLALLICVVPYTSADINNEAEPTAEAAPAEEASPKPSDPAPTPEPTPTAEPSESPTPEPSPTPTPEPSPSPTPEPSPSPTPEPSPEPSPSPEPTPDATVEPTEPAETPTPAPTPMPESTATPEPGHTSVPSPAPTPSPSPEPLPTLVPAASLTPEGDESEDTQDEVGDGSGLKPTNNKPRLDWRGVVPADDGGMPIPRLYQYDYKTVLCRYDGIPRSVSTSGCSVTSVAMVAAYLTGEEHSPEKLFSWAIKNGLYHGNGLSHSSISKVAANYGVSGKWIGRSGDAVIEALKAGKPVIAHMGPGIFAKRGHYIVLRGVTEDGKILVNDPNSAYRSGLAYPMKTILKESRNEKPFMVCDVK